MNKIAVFFTLFLCCSCVLCGAQAYEIVWLGDMHYDSPDLHTKEYVERQEQSSKNRLRRNLYSWVDSGLSNLVLEKASKAAQNTPFAFEIGDFAHGFAGSQAQATTMYTDAISRISGLFTVPFYFCPGNHEYRGIGAKTLDKTLLPYLKQKLNPSVKLKGYNFVLTHENDLFVFWDSIKPDLSWLKHTLNEHSAARYIFIITHYPVLPVFRGKFDRISLNKEHVEWIPFAKESQSSERRSLLNLLSSHNVIVLCGHIHEQTLLEYADPQGKITQISAYSLFEPDAPALNGPLHEGDVKLYEEKMSVQKILSKGGAMAELLNDYIPHLTRYAYLKGAGYCVLHIDDGGITNEFRSIKVGDTPQISIIR
jgi:UDP-2,3-diacylglucosamine pyrophosphatase LpxH